MRLAPSESLPGPLLWPAHPRTPHASSSSSCGTLDGSPRTARGPGGLGPQLPLPWGLVRLLLSRFPFRSKVGWFSRVPAGSLGLTCFSQQRGFWGLPGAGGAAGPGAALPEGPGRPSVRATPCPPVPRGCLGRVRLSTYEAHILGDGSACGRGAHAAARPSVLEAPGLAA